MARSRRLVLAALAVLLSAAAPPVAPSPPPAPPTAEDAKRFIKSTNAELKRLGTRVATADWIRATYITDDTERNAATFNAELMAALTRVIQESKRFDGVAVDPDTGRALKLLKLATSLPAPSDAGRREELAAVAAKLEGMYGKAKACAPGGKPPCRDINELEEVLRSSRDERELFFAWQGWHDAARPMKPHYERLVTLGNEGARELGFRDLGDLWRSNYEMSPADFEAEVERLWKQVEPLYRELHCYVRAKLSQHYGAPKVSPSGPLPAHLLGNMWAQEWSNIYPLVEPYAGQPSLDVTDSLKAQNYDAVRLVKLGESFFGSLGFDPLPQTFWERSMLVKPRDREVVCHASAWDITYENDVRVKMCIKVNEEDLVTVHHELGHIFYYQRYHRLPFLFQQGAHDGFHEAVGDAIARSITPQYLKSVGLLQNVGTSREAVVNQQLKDALEKVAFLPFARLVDQWRYDVFAGKIPPAQYNRAWWALKLKYQGVAPAVARADAEFDPGAKFHVPGNTPYARYFLATMLQFQFHRGMCRAAGHKGLLHECSVFRSRAAGDRLRAMLALGASRPWPDALAQLTGERRMDADALLDYFTPLRAWLAEQNRGRTCGW